MGYYSIYGVNQVSLRSIFSGTISVICIAQDISDMGVLCLPSLMELCKSHYQTPHEMVLGVFMP